MLSRREMLAGGLVGAVGRAPAGAAEQPAGDQAALRRIEEAIEAVGDSLDRAYNGLPMSDGFVAALRKYFEQFVKGSGKFPDFCDVGINGFYQVYDWHVRNRQPILATRQADNRYTLQFMFTTLILRFENEPNFIGVPYDKA
jgi:hypothetical protein